MSPKKGSKKDKDENQEPDPKYRGLGRGLGALFEDEEGVYPQVEEGDPSAVRKTLGIEQLSPAADQPRTFFDDKAIKELAESIKEFGILQPILVRPDKVVADQYEIVAGERRWRAAQLAQLHDVPVVIRDLDDVSTFQIALIENLQRRDLNAVEEARGYQRLVDEFGHSPEDVGKVLGKSRSHVANMIRLLQLPDSVQTMLVNEELSAGHARALLKAEQPTILAQEIIRDNLSVRDTEKLVAASEGREIKHRSDKKSVKSNAPKSKDADTLALENEVSNQIGMRVAIDMKNASEGLMTINFKSLDQLDDVLRRLSQTPKSIV